MLFPVIAVLAVPSETIRWSPPFWQVSPQRFPAGSGLVERCGIVFHPRCDLSEAHHMGFLGIYIFDVE